MGPVGCCGMRLPARIAALMVALGALALVPATVGASERTLTLFSKPITVPPYVQQQQYMSLDRNGIEAPDKPGWITRMDADVVSSRDANAKTLPIQDVMVHHLVYHQDGVSSSPANCGGRFFARGEERQVFDFPDGYGIPNRRANGQAPHWLLTHMLMNHRSYAQTVYVRIRVTYTDQPQKELTPLWIDTKGCDVDPVYDVPGGGKPGSTFRDTTDWRVPFDGRIIAAGGHLHGGGKFLKLRDATCDRTLVDSRAYYGLPKNQFYRVRPKLHEPSPVRIGVYNTAQGIPISQGSLLQSTAGYDNSNIHTRVMNIMIAYMTREPVPKCGPMPTDLKLTNLPRRFRSKPPRFIVPLIKKPTGPFQALSGPLSVGDFFIKAQRVTIQRGQQVTWNFDGSTLHNITVANGPRGFSSPWTEKGSFSYAPTKRGTYRIYCSLHPVAMTEELRVR